MSLSTISVIQLPHYKGDGLSLKTTGSAGYDIHYSGDNPLVAADFWKGPVKVDTGIRVHIGYPGIVGLLATRSSIGHNLNCSLSQGVGVIDSDYQGEIKCSLSMHGVDAFDPAPLIRPGDRIAQLLFVQLAATRIEVTDQFVGSTSRGQGGFGSTGE